MVAFLNEGDGRFRKETLYAAPHPAYGCSGIQLVDLNGDGRLDVLYTNGDVLDSPYLLKPYHGVQWLENRGTTDRLDFEHRPIARDVRRPPARRRPTWTATATSTWSPSASCPANSSRSGDARDVDAIVLFEQTAPGKFARHTLASKTCDHVTCGAGRRVRHRAGRPRHRQLHDGRACRQPAHPPQPRAGRGQEVRGRVVVAAGS